MLVEQWRTLADYIPLPNICSLEFGNLQMFQGEPISRVVFLIHGSTRTSCMYYHMTLIKVCKYQVKNKVIYYDFGVTLINIAGYDNHPTLWD